MLFGIMGFIGTLVVLYPENFGMNLYVVCSSSRYWQWPAAR